MNDCIEIIPLDQGTAAWHKFRQKHLGASDAPIYMGISPWETPYGLWQQKLGLKPGLEENDAMRRGKEKEGLARDVFCHRMNLRFEPAVIKNSSYPHLCASMDGICSSVNNLIQAGVEIKVPGKIDHESAMDGVIPEKYQWQLAQQMIVCDLDMIYYFSWNENSSKIIEFSCDQEKKTHLLTKAENFWDCLQNLKEPALTDRDYVNMGNDPKWMVATALWKDAKNKREEWEKLEKDYRNKLIEYSQDKCCQGNDVRLTKYVSRGRVDMDKIIKDTGVDKEQYRKPNTVAWRIS